MNHVGSCPTISFPPMGCYEMGFKTGLNSSKQPSEEKRRLQDVFKPAVELESVRGLKFALYGKAKVGKTHFCMTARRPIYIIDTEGSASVNKAAFPKEVQEEMFIAEVIQAASKRDKEIDLVKSLDALVEAIDIVTDAVITSEEENTPRGTIVIDSATDIWDWLGIWLDEAAGAKTTKSGDMPRFEWGKANKKYAEMMYMLLRSGWNVVMTFRAKSAVNSKGEDLGYIVPRWQKNTDYWMDLIGEMSKDAHRRIIFRGGRYGEHIPDLVDPTWDSLEQHLSKITGITFR